MSLKPPYLGEDVNRDQYWFFGSELYIRYKSNAEWGKFMTESEVSQLDESLSMKGIREKKLKENLKKIKGKIRIKSKKKMEIKSEEDNEMNDGEEEVKV